MKYPGKKMVLLADNSPYNYEMKIGSLSAGIKNNSIAHDKTLEKIVTWTVIYTQLLIYFLNYRLIVKNVADLFEKLSVQNLFQFARVDRIACCR